MSWQEEFERKLVTAEEAVSGIKSGDRIALCMLQAPLALVGALTERMHDLQDVRFVGTAIGYDPGWYQPGNQKHFWMDNEIFNSPASREAMAQGLSDYLIATFSTAFKAFDERREEAKPIDVTFLVVSPPDAKGYCNIGPCLWNKKAYAKRAKRVIAEIDPNIAKFYGEGYIHVSEIDYFVQTEGYPPMYMPAPVVTDNVSRIAKHLSTVVRDGMTVQVGTGVTSAALIAAGALDNCNDLGCHCEMFVFHGVRLIMRGIMNSKYKNIEPGIHIATSWMGDEEEMAFCAENPICEVRPAEYVDNFRVVAAHDNMLAVNNAVSVDLTGQICSESIGTRMYNGVGGQPEFHIGAFLSKGGQAVTVLPSTTSDEEITRIVPYIADGSFVTIPRYFADTVITEYGVARLVGKGQSERVEELIKIAHPKFRDELLAEARKRFPRVI